MNRQFLFIKSATESIALPVDSFSHAEYTSDTTVSSYFNAIRSGKDASVKVVLTVSSGKANDVVSAITSQVAAGNAPVIKMDDVTNVFHIKNVTGITSITTTESPSITTGPTGATGPTGPAGAAGADGAAGAAGSDATGLGGTDQTLTGDRSISIGGSNSLSVKCGNSNTLTPFSITPDANNPATIAFNGDLRFDSGLTSGGVLKLEEFAGSGNNFVALKAPTSLAADATFVLPATDGTANQVLKTDGSGNFGFSDHAAKTYSSISCGFFDDIGTGTHYLPLNGAPTEQASDNNSYTDWVCPCDIVVKSVQMRFSNLSGNGDITMTVEKDAIGASVDTDVESEVVSVTSTDDQDVVHFLFDNAALSKGEKLKIKILASSDVTGTGNIFAVVVYEANWSTRYTQASGVISS